MPCQKKKKIENDIIGFGLKMESPPFETAGCAVYFAN
jgi:hypothetical protein